MLERCELPDGESLVIFLSCCKRSMTISLIEDRAKKLSSGQCQPPLHFPSKRLFFTSESEWETRQALFLR